jgi:hypothetical protein
MKITITLAILMFPILIQAQKCDKYFKREVDKFDGKTTITTNMLGNVAFYKVIPPDGSPTTFLVLHATGHTPAVNEKGVIIILSDGTKIVRPNQGIDVEVSEGTSFGSGPYTYRAFFSVTDDELKQMAQSGITDFRLYIFDYKMKKSQIEFNKLASGCITSIN